MGRLTATQVRAFKLPGRYHDGDGLILDVSGKGAASWILRAQVDGRRREFGLGSLKNVSLSEARAKAADVRKQWRAGTDPVAARRAANLTIPNFRQAATRVHLERKASWRNGKHEDQWLSSLERHVFPKIGDLLVSDVSGASIRDVLIEVWLSKPETARRIRQRIDAVLGWAVANEFRDTLPPTKAIVASLPKQTQREDRHHSAMPYADLPAFLRILRSKESTGRLALEALILTAARSNEIRGACWDEIDFEKRTWFIPKERMKSHRPHRVPLSDQALSVFSRALELRPRGSDLVFPGLKRKNPLSDMTLLKVLRDAALPFTVHGFRSTFRDWVAEQTNFSPEVAEAALAHAIPDKVVAAYKRTDFFDKRRSLMASWGRFADASSGVVVQFRA